MIMNCIVDCHVDMVSESAEATRSILHDGFLCVREREGVCVRENILNSEAHFIPSSSGR